MDFYLDKDEDNPGNTDGHSLRHTMEKETTTTKQHILTEGLKEGGSFMKHTLSTGDVNHQQVVNRFTQIGVVTTRSVHTESGDYNLPPDIQTTYGEKCASADDAPSSNVEPLDCTSSDVNQLQSAKHEPLDYTLDTDMDSEYNRSCMMEKVLYNPEENAQRQGSDPPSAPCWHLALVKTTTTIH